MRTWFAFLLCLSVFYLQAQPYSVAGRVTDAETNQALAFVNIVLNNSYTGVVSDIDGRFRITSKEPIHSLHFSYLGYVKQYFYITDPVKPVEVKMQRLAYELPEFTIIAGDNPAHRIIQLAIQNRTRNNYENLPSFSYTAYDKMIFTIDENLLIAEDTLSVDTSLVRLKEFLDEQHFFIMETVAERKFLYPGRNHHKVTARRMSGLKDPIFTLLISQLQSTSFYDDVISISDKNYVNPISRGSTNRYSFTLQDTLIMAGSADTTFIISYHPKPNTNFDGLQGVLHINSNRWAIQHVIAEPARQEKGMAVKIQQMYELVENMYWFPVQLNTDIVFKNVMVNDFYPVGKGKSYISNIVVNPQLVRRMFNEVNVDVDPNADHLSENEWERLRAIGLTEKDLRTYHIIDSLGRAHHFDRYAMSLESLVGGNIPVGKFHIPVKRLARYNKHEKAYLGVGLTTSQRISRIAKMGAYLGYGFGDKKAKYGGECNIDLKRSKDASWYFRIINDVTETGKIDPFASGIFGFEEYRDLLVRQMDHIKEVASGFQYRLFPYLLADINMKRSWNAPQYGYFYGLANEPAFPKVYVFSEVSAGFRFVYGEKIIQTARSRISLGSDYPVFSFRVTQGLNNFLDSGHPYRIYDFKAEYSFYTKYLGKTSMVLRAGMVDSDVPYQKLYSGFGSYGGFTIHSPASFATMRMNEFVADEYLNVYLTHSFGKLLIRTKRFEPEFVIASHAGIGRLQNQKHEKHSIPLNSFEKGYFESGLLINNLLDLNLMNLGLGSFYRYGPYSLPGFKKNISWHLTLNFPFTR